MSEHGADAPPPTSEQRAARKLAPLRLGVDSAPRLRKPEWIRARAPTDARVLRLKSILRAERLHTVCEEAACPNLGECYAQGTATFMIMGDLCTRRCPFCAVAHGRPLPLDPEEPSRVAYAVARMGLSYVVITSVDRDDLADGGAGHFVACIRAVRTAVPGIQIEVLVPDFRKRLEVALEWFREALPDVLNHNLETVPRLYKKARPGADYSGSLRLLRDFKAAHPQVPTKSGIMLGLGETLDEVYGLLRDLRAEHCDMLTIGQYLQPSRHHLPVARYVSPQEFRALGDFARQLGFASVASGPMVRSSYHADLQRRGEPVGLTPETT
ncbi:MAG: lipoyl synthase [Gammaproteobacteria bacterium]